MPQVETNRGAKTLAWFAQGMQAKLNLRASKGPWETTSAYDHMNEVIYELEELSDAVAVAYLKIGRHGQGPLTREVADELKQEVLYEAADVALRAMMAADVVCKRIERAVQLTEIGGEPIER